MALVFNGSSNVITGLATGGLPDGSVATADLADGAVTAAKRGAGAILQVQATTITTSESRSSNSFADTGLVVSITPSSSSNKILCHVDLQCSGGNNSQHYYKLVRVVSGSESNVAFGTSGGLDGFFGEHFATPYSNHYSLSSVSISSYDTAVSTAAHSYRVRWCARAGTAYLNRTGYTTSGDQYSFSGASTITVMEVAV